VGEYNTRERFALPLPGMRDLKKILIASEEYATEGRRPGQQNAIVRFGMIVFLGSGDGQIPGAQSIRDTLRHMHVHVEVKAQAGLCNRLKR
jgi:hypothetical protein